MMWSSSLRTTQVLFVVVVLWNLLLFQWFASQMSEMRKALGELQSELREQVAVNVDRVSLPRADVDNGGGVRRNGALLGSDRRAQRSDERIDDVDVGDRSSARTADVANTTSAADAAAVLLPVIVFCFDRAEYLKQSLTTLFK